ncbi:MAG: glycerophosphodiester phosphodiesterase [Arenicella sp.]
MKGITLLFALAVLFSIKSVNAFELIAHRGINGSLKENTLEAIESAWKKGADAVEVDVRMSVDGILYLFHDPSIGGVPVKQLSYERIKQLDPDIVRLETVFELGIPPGYYILDFKETDPSFIKTLSKLLVSNLFPEAKIALQSSDASVLKSLKKAKPEMNLIKLSKLRRNLPWVINPENKRLLRELTALNITTLNIQGRQFIDENYLQLFQDKGIKVIVWTINDLQRIQHYKNIGADGVVTDVLDDILQHLPF